LESFWNLAKAEQDSFVPGTCSLSFLVQRQSEKIVIFRTCDNQLRCIHHLVGLSVMKNDPMYFWGDQLDDYAYVKSWALVLTGFGGVNK